MAHIISVINLKGGVGKSTTTVALAETLSGKLRKRVLVIDLDPQTSATLMLIGEERWWKLSEDGCTLAQLFKDALGMDKTQFDFDATLQKGVSDVSTAKTIDLLPSSLDLIDMQERLASMAHGKFYGANPLEFLARSIKSRLDDYDMVIVDCPPSLGIITMNGLNISQGYIIPTIPDHLSIYGIPQVNKRVHMFSEHIERSIEPLGIILTKFQSNSAIHNAVRRTILPAQGYVFNTIIPQSNHIAAATEYVGTPRTLGQKYGYHEASLYLKLAEEIWARLQEKF